MYSRRQFPSKMESPQRPPARDTSRSAFLRPRSCHRGHDGLRRTRLNRGVPGLPGVAIVDPGACCGVDFSIGGLIQALRRKAGLRRSSCVDWAEHSRVPLLASAVRRMRGFDSAVKRRGLARSIGSGSEPPAARAGISSRPRAPSDPGEEFNSPTGSHFTRCALPHPWCDSYWECW